MPCPASFFFPLDSNSARAGQRAYSRRFIHKIIALSLVDPRHPRPPDPGYPRCTRATTTRTRRARWRRLILQSRGIFARLARASSGSRQLALFTERLLNADSFSTAFFTRRSRRRLATAHYRRQWHRPDAIRSFSTWRANESTDVPCEQPRTTRRRCALFFLSSSHLFAHITENNMVYTSRFFFCFAL
jgi:hypothetical protein